MLLALRLQICLGRCPHIGAFLPPETSLRAASAALHRQGADKIQGRNPTVHTIVKLCSRLSVGTYQAPGAAQVSVCGTCDLSLCCAPAKGWDKLAFAHRSRCRFRHHVTVKMHFSGFQLVYQRNIETHDFQVLRAKA